MVQRSMEADTLPPVHTSQQLQRTLNRVNKKSARGSGNGSGSGAQILRTGSGSSRGSSPMVDTLRMTASTNKLPPKTASYEDFIMESLMEHCRTLQARVQVSSTPYLLIMFLRKIIHIIANHNAIYDIVGP